MASTEESPDMEYDISFDKVPTLTIHEKSSPQNDFGRVSSQEVIGTANLHVLP